MFTLTSEHSFDAAHFLAGYEGKCSNIHGHRWRVIIEIFSDNLNNDMQTRGMVVDFHNLKDDIQEVVDYFDHALIIEKNSLKPKTYEALREEGIKLIEVDFRTTAENFSKYFFEKMEEKGYQVKKSSVYETPNNMASYSRD